MTGRLLIGIGIVFAGATVLGACSEDDDGDLLTFCAEVEQLRDDDPFADLQIASPQEMRSAFDDLEEAVARIDAAAPADVQTQAARYRDTLDEVIDHLRGAGYDPRQLDALAYGEATAEYGEAADSLDNAADSLCE